jgi:hypothetical protein
MDGHVCNYGAKNQEGGAINEPKDGEDGKNGEDGQINSLSFLVPTLLRGNEELQTYNLMLKYN